MGQKALSGNLNITKMTEIEKFNKFFTKLGELCFQIHMAERPIRPIDFTSEKNQVINHDYFIEVKQRYPNVIRGFNMTMGRSQFEGVEFYLMNDGKVSVEYINSDMRLLKTNTYESVSKVQEDLPAYIHFLTRRWNPI